MHACHPERSKGSQGSVRGSMSSPLRDSFSHTLLQNDKKCLWQTSLDLCRTFVLLCRNKVKNSHVNYPLRFLIIESWIFSYLRCFMSLRNDNIYNSDLPPEYCQYNDTGCEFSETCLNCPLPICVFDEPGGKRRFVKHNRAVEMAQLHNKAGKSVRELAVIFGVSTRTVQRALKSVRNKNWFILSFTTASVE